MSAVAFRVVGWTMTIAVGAVLYGCAPDERHDPEPYKQYIQEIDTLLQKPTAEEGDGIAIATNCNELAGALGKNIKRPSARETVMNTIMVFGESLAAAEDLAIQYREEGQPVVPFDVTETRTQWELIRETIFKPASWFQ